MPMHEPAWMTEAACTPNNPVLALTSRTYPCLAVVPKYFEE